jgi:hypothetical protein
VRADEKLTAFVELEAAIRARSELSFGGIAQLVERLVRNKFRLDDAARGNARFS